MRPETKPTLQIRKIRGQNLVCKYGTIKKDIPIRCNKKATHFIILGPDKLPACTTHTIAYVSQCEWDQWRRTTKKIGQQRW